jgi:hypothetical protein
MKKKKFKPLSAQRKEKNVPPLPSDLRVSNSQLQKILFKISKKHSHCRQCECFFTTRTLFNSLLIKPMACFGANPRVAVRKNGEVAAPGGAPVFSHRQAPRFSL